MSYSFNKHAGSKAEVLALVAAALAEVVAQQPAHAADQAQALVATEAFVAIIPEPAADQDVSVSLHGSVSWRDDQVVLSAVVGVAVCLVTKEPV
jgi:hypothetical protein